MKSGFYFFALTIFTIASCNDYYKSRAQERAEYLMKSDSVSGEFERMEDTIHIQTIVGYFTLYTKTRLTQSTCSLHGLCVRGKAKQDTSSKTK